MPSAKRKIAEKQRTLERLSKKSRSISDFFTGGSRRDEPADDEPSDNTPPSKEITSDSTEQVSSSEVTDCTTPVSSESARKKAKHKCGFRSEWINNRPWLFNKCEEVDGDVTEVMYCRLCVKHKSHGLNGNAVWVQKGCRTLRLDKVVGHEQSDQHQTAVKLETQAQVGIDNALNNRPLLNEKEFQAVVCATKLLHFLIKHNIPHTTVYEDLIDFAVDELQSPVLAHLQRGKNATYKSQTTADELLAAMSADIEETVLQRVRSSPAYAVMTDETQDISNRKHLAFCTKYVDHENGAVCTDYIKDVQISDGKAETIFEETRKVVEQDLRLDSFSAFGSDGCNAMVGKKSGVSTRLKEIKPDLVTVHCHNHRLALAAKNSFEEIPEFKETDVVLSSIYNYYKYSGNRTASLQKLQSMLDDCGAKKIKQAAHTRWLSHLDSVTSLRDTYAAVIMDLENCVESGNDRVRVGSGPSASGLVKKLKCYKTIHIIHFLCDALRPLTQLALVFEKNDVDLSVIKPRMETTITALERMKTTPGLNTKKVPKVLQELNITPDDKTKASVEKAENQFLDNLVKNIHIRMGSSDIIDCMSVFNMSSCEAMVGGEEVETLADHFGLDVDQCLHEWDQLKECLKDIPSDNIQGPRAVLKAIYDLKPTVGHIIPMVEKLCGIAAVVPVSTAEVERVFSDVNRTVTELRNRLTVQTTHKLLMIHQNDKYLNFEQAVRRWHKQHPRRIQF